MIQLVYLAAL